MYDCIIIGAGPAGITAAIYAARKKLNVIVISKNVGGQTAESWLIENYVGFSVISGAELASKFREHLEKFKIQLKGGAEVLRVEKEDKKFKVYTSREIYEGKTIIVASGKIARVLNVPGEKEFVGKGITYCATCDAPLFAKKDVAVVGGGNAALGAALQLDKIGNKIYLINLASNLTGDAVLIDKVKQSKKIEIHNNSRVTKIFGDKFVKELEFENLSAKSKKVIKVQGVFVEIGSAPSTNFVKDLVALNKNGEIIIDKQNATSQEGVFAAGDVTDVIEKQIIVAAGEGAKAALSAYDYLIKRRE
jgi:alkyl hydroperoxide reductase subunit F